MMLTFSVVAVLVLAVVDDGNAAVLSKPATCTAKYEGKATDTHTMCLVDNPDATEVTLTPEVKAAILKGHNDIRAGVIPTATNMQKMVWDDRLAKVATKWAMQCLEKHDKNRTEPELPGFVGQNAAYGHKSFDHAVQAWYSEIKDWTFGEWTYVTGHYIQEIFHSASRVGCGQAQCPSRPIYICNYFSGTFSNQDPYEAGPSCSKCPDKCDESGKLCDCGGKVCNNGGTLDLNTCTCQCQPLWTGDDCTTKNCPKKDFQNWCSYSTFDAVTKCPTNKYYTENCPIACGVCEAPCKGTVCQHKGTINPDTCTCTCPKGYSGDLCETCPAQDVNWCHLAKDKCNVWSNMYWDCSNFCKFC
ncbi:cysteine-rich venom protein Mr30-like [Littorina saxatilis]|uniref:Uncharacterized protein n=1 Tax=Littorina saxatilis TaxID=31220 RepID=A0AAN9BJT1_9CAEN